MKITQADCIRTGRLELRSYESGDAKRIVELLTNPEVSKTFMVPGFQSEQQAMDLAHKLIAFSKTEDTAHLEYGIYLDGTLIGFVNDCGTEDGEIEIGYVIHPDCKGRGYATEAVSAVIGDLFRMGFQRVTAGFFEENAASRRVMEKCGMQPLERSERIEYRGVSRVCRYFSIQNS